RGQRERPEGEVVPRNPACPAGRGDKDVVPPELLVERGVVTVDPPAGEGRLALPGSPSVRIGAEPEVGAHGLGPPAVERQDPGVSRPAPPREPAPPPEARRVQHEHRDAEGGRSPAHESEEAFAVAWPG